MRAGHAFSVSLEMLADESIPPLSLEFRRIFNEQNLGSSLDSALKNMAARVPLVDVRFFVSAVLLRPEFQKKMTGTELRNRLGLAREHLLGPNSGPAL